MIDNLKKIISASAPYILGWLFMSICGFLLFLGILDVVIFFGMVI